MITAAAGPLANVCVAVLGTILLALMVRFNPGAAGVGGAIESLLRTMIFLNVILAVFNALPIPPLDGSHVVDALVPDALRPAWESLSWLGPVALLGVILLPLWLGVSIFSWPLQAIEWLLNQLGP